MNQKYTPCLNAHTVLFKSGPAVVGAAESRSGNRKANVVYFKIVWRVF